MQFPIEVLLVPGSVIFLATLIIAFEVTRSVVFSTIASLIKSGVFILYFGVLFDGTFTFIDDWSYLDLASEMADQELGIMDIFDNIDALQGISGGEHYGYSLYNVYAFKFFGFGYYAPVALNILLTVLIAWVGANLAALEFKFTGPWRKVFFAFLLFHPDIFAWSNIMNGKDTVILLLHILLLYSASMYFRGDVLKALILGFTVSAMLSALRFYVPFLFAGALGLSLFLITSRTYSNALKFTVVGFILTILVLTDYFELSVHLHAIQGDLVNPAYGLLRFMVTPVPFNTQPEYAFLNIPALIHWLLMPFVVLGFITIIKEATDYEHFFIFYVLIFLVLYSCYGELQGPRHRVQIDYAWAVLQFMGLKPYLRMAFTMPEEEARRRGLA